MAKDKLFTRSYVCILAANFLLFFGFWLLVPVLPFYLKETYGCEEMIIGAVLSCYTVSCLCVRPFSGFLMDRFPRKPIYILCYFVCVMMFPAYTAAAAISWFIALRALHGVAFGGVTVGGNTLCVDIMPSSRRGEGLGYYGLTNNIAMALGPMTGLFMHDHFTYMQIFISGMLVSVAGFVCAVAVKARMPESLRARRQMEAAGDTPAPQVTRKLSLDRFILLKGIPVSVSLFLLSIPYGATTNFVAMYAREIHITAPAGLFFTFMALGMGASRIVAGKKVDRGYITQCIHVGYYPVITAFFMLSMCRFVAPADIIVATAMFYTVPLLLGAGFGIMFPAMNFPVHQSCAEQPASHRHKHLSHRLGRGHRHRNRRQRCDSSALHVLHGISHRLGALPHLAALFYNAGHSSLLPQPAQVTASLVRSGYDAYWEASCFLFAATVV